MAVTFFTFFFVNKIKTEVDRFYKRCIFGHENDIARQQKKKRPIVGISCLTHNSLPKQKTQKTSLATFVRLSYISIYMSF